jgi:moderate conductance mechanosensitive channel
VSRLEARMARRAPAAEALVLTEEAKRRDAILGVITYVGVFLTWAIGGFMIVQRLGVNTGPLVASAGVLGLAIGFGAQSLVRDVVSGFFIIAENQYGIGDVIEINSGSGITGTVERVTLRTTVLRAVSGEAHIVPNGQILRVKNMSKEWARAVIDVVLAYSADVEVALEALGDATRTLRDDAELAPFLLEDPEVWGVEVLGDKSVQVRVVAKTLPLKQWAVARELRRLVLDELRARQVALPSP